MIAGDKVSLRAVEQDDLETLMKWRNNPELRKNFREYREINRDMQTKWYQKKVLEDPSTLMFSIINNDTGELLGCCGLCYIDWINRHADLSLYIGWNNLYIDEAGFADESCKLLLNYGFKELNINKIYAEIYEFDSKKHAFLRNIGFRQDGKLREHCYYGGRYWDSYIFSLLKRDYCK